MSQPEIIDKEYQNYYVVVYQETWTDPFKPRKKTVKILNEHDHDCDDKMQELIDGGREVMSVIQILSGDD